MNKIQLLKEVKTAQLNLLLGEYRTVKDILEELRIHLEEDLNNETK